jgi:hypothetical protein
MRWLAICVLLSGCTSDDTPSDLGVEDLSASSDLTVGGPVGAACAANADCAEGKTPTCWQKTLVNKTGTFPTPGGYCSSPCTSDADCGENAGCFAISTLGKWCLSKCTAASDCRGAPDWACVLLFVQPVCYPAPNLTCDPSANDGECQIQTGAPGGCFRLALGSGNTGTCQEQCVIGVGNCNTGAGGHCTFSDRTFDLTTGMMTADLFRGGICAYGPPGSDEGQPCTRLTACADGLECDLQVPVKNPNGTNLCRQLCFLPGGGYDADGGTISVPGMVAGSCPVGKTCTDVFGEAGNSRPETRVGLCI